MSTHVGTVRRHVMWLCVYGPTLSLLPERFRNQRFVRRFGSWDAATLISGVIECVFGTNTFIYWYKEQVDQLVILLIAVYLVCDGVWRILILRMHGESVGTVFLAVADQMFLFGKRTLWTVSHPAVSDMVVLDDRNSEWQLKIESSRSKRDWQATRIIRYGERYFRIETVLRADGPRPFVYLLRALPAAVPSHNVITYPPLDLSQYSE